MNTNKLIAKLKNFAKTNIVPLLFTIFIIIIAPFSGYSFHHLIQEIVVRISRNAFLVLSLLLPILAGMGLNFGIVLGAMAGQIALIFITDWNIVGLNGVFLAMIISAPLAILCGYLAGKILNKAKGREMVSSFILAFLANGIYQLILLYGMGTVIPIQNPNLILSRGYGIRSTVNLLSLYNSVDSFWALNLFGISFPLFSFFLTFLLCLFLWWFYKTKLSQDMRGIRESQELSTSAGINVNKTRLVAMILSTLFAAFGMIIYLQNIGTMGTYNSHEQVGMFSIAALLVGGASVNRARISNVFIGVILFHFMFIVSPQVGKNLIGSAILGEYFRVFISYAVISIALVLYEWGKTKNKNLIETLEIEEALK